MPLEAAGTFRGRVHGLMFSRTPAAKALEAAVFALIVTSTLSFMLETTDFVGRSREVFGLR